APPPSLNTAQAAREREREKDVVVRAPPPQPAGSPGVGPQPGVQDLLPRQRELLPGRPRRRRRAGPGQPQGRPPALVPRSCSGSGARATTSAGRSSLGERTKETTSWYPNNNSAGCGDPKIKEAGCDASRTSRVVFASDSQPLWG
ncbi:hydroxyproline-rich glycoprotein family protein, partial [Zea mays]